MTKSTPAAGDGGNEPEDNSNTQGGGSNNNSGGSNDPAVDLKNLPAEQLSAVLENPLLWKQPRIAELLESSKELKTLKTANATAEETRLAEQKKFEDLANKRGERISELEAQLKTSTIDQSLSQSLIKESVIDLDGALKLVDRSKISVDDNGQITGVEEALETLKKDKTYLFKPGDPKPVIGSPSNDTNTSTGGPAKFKRSQLQDPKFYADNREEILKASRAGLIEDDVSPHS